MPRLFLRCRIFWLCAAVLFIPSLKADPALVGALQSTAGHAPELKSAGLELAVCELAWSRFEPSPGKVDPSYVAEIKSEIAAFHRAGQAVILDPGVQYPPEWILQLPHSRYVNQYQAPYIEKGPGKNIGNAVFNQAIRDEMAAYHAMVFSELGTDFYAVRLGGGWYNELNYPPAKFGQRTNCYWAFDPIAQGQLPGLPPGVAPCPVPGWKPGDKEPPGAARAFTGWYLDSLGNYHDWQIQSMREHYSGRLLMMYPSWGIRPGQLDAAIAKNLDGNTPAERNGEIQSGFDFSRFIHGIADPDVLVHTTWIDSAPGFGDDFGSDPAQWSPLHFLSSLARQHTPPLAVSAENTGGGDKAVMILCRDRVNLYGAKVFLWAFESDLLRRDRQGLHDFKRVFSVSP